MNLRWPGVWVSILTAGVLAPSIALGTTFIRTNAFSLGPRETLTSDLWLMANQIHLAGDVQDDVFLLASPASVWREDPRDGLVTLAGTFHNDVWAMGNSVVLTGVIQDHARFLARTITLSGSIAHASMFAGNTIHLTRAADIAADVWMAGENLIAEGWVERNLTLIGKNVTLAGAFGQDVHVIAQDFVALPGTEIVGNLVYRCPREFVPDSRVIVHGQIIRESMSETATGLSRGFSLESFLYQSWLFLGALLAAMLCLAVFPVFTARVVQNLRHSLWKCMATGIMALCLVPLAALISLLSLIGIPLGLLLLASLVSLVYLSKIMVAILLGLWLLRRPEPRSYAQFLMPLVIGLVFIYAGVNSGLPGLAVWFVVTSAGLGSLVQALFAGPSRINPDPITPPPRVPPQPHS